MEALRFTMTNMVYPMMNHVTHSYFPLLPQCLCDLGSLDIQQTQGNSFLCLPFSLSLSVTHTVPPQVFSCLFFFLLVFPFLRSLSNALFADVFFIFACSELYAIAD